MPPASEAAVDPAAQHRPAAGRLDVLQSQTLTAPTAIACLRCQLIGKRRLTCSKAHVCAELPQSFALGPILLAAWAATAVAFVIAVL
jgi:hypothetical protein